jgi:hypothetical protein
MQKNVHYEISCRCTKSIGNVAPQSCPKMFETKERKNVTLEIVYPGHYHYLFHDPNNIFVASPWPW